MRRQLHQDSSSTARIAILTMALFVVLALGWTTSAQAQTQCSGSIILSPDKGQNPPGDVLESGEALSIGVSIFNTTTVGGAPAAASVRNTTTVILSCATEFPCVSELNALTFVSCTGETGVTCVVDPMNANHVLLTYDGNAKLLAAAGVTDLATINVTATPGQHIVNPASGEFFTVGDTGAGNLFNANCAGSGQGSAPLFYPGICGDGFTDPELGEQCDDGNDVPFDGCGTPEGNCLICPDSTPCPDTDNNECTDAGCDASGFCDQNHTLPNSEPCTDTGNECAAAGCNGAGQCDQLHTPVTDSTPCTDNDGNVCTEAGCQAGLCDQNHVLPNSKPCTDTGNECAAAGCDGAGSCDQLHTPVQDSTPCTDNDGNVCTEAGCQAGQCDQNHVLPNSKPCDDTTNECAAAGCDGAGFCDQNHTPVGDSSPCTDNDGNECTEAGCQAGQCDQNHVLPNSKPCDDTTNECAAAGCDGAGNCDQLHTPVQDSTPCGDTDDNTCTEAGCSAGVCNQRHVLPDSKPCPDTANECAEAGCNGAGICDQNHVLDTNGTPCTDSDGSQCTDPACVNGVCDQDEGGVVTCEDPVCTECDPTDGVCKDIQPPPQQCIPFEAICRTPGFWGTHGGTEKNRSQNITQEVIDAAGGCLNVCGEIITNTEKDNAESALEAICVSVKGQQELQLARQLTAMALNCVVSGFGPDCSGNEALGALFGDCNEACVTGEIGDCIAEVDCFNNGGSIVEGNCVIDSENNCHERQLCNEEIGLCFQPPGPAGSAKACSAVRGNGCTVIQPGEAKCSAGDTSEDPEVCDE